MFHSVAYNNYPHFIRFLFCITPWGETESLTAGRSLAAGSLPRVWVFRTAYLLHHKISTRPVYFVSRR